MTVAEFKALVAAIPDKLDGLSVEWPDGLVLSIIADEYSAKDGGRFFSTVAVLDPGNKAAPVEEFPHVEQDYSKLYLPDGSRNAAAFESDGRIKRDATLKGGRGVQELGVGLPGGGRP